ncbi:hypothetical protein Fmac_002679 [Flemingia macrophylla]|uniref:phosphoserine transaminase n=1 Tax=Flemingia macrophylla TaxID=520843 RepID=A0ABD1NKP0_9FABA
MEKKKKKKRKIEKKKKGKMKKKKKKKKKKGKMDTKKKKRFYMSKGFYRFPIDNYVRSLMNVPLTLERVELEGDFIKEATKENMVQLKGHRSVGGIKASIYNAMPLAGVQKLLAFMKDFQSKYD